VNAECSRAFPERRDRNILQRGRAPRLKASGGKTACLAIVLAGALAVTAARPAVAASIAIDAERNGDTIDIRASAVLKADAATSWRVLTDYDRYTEFIPELRESRVVARRDATVTVEQSGDAALWLFRIPLHITFEIQETPPRSLQSRAVAGGLRALRSRYVLTPVGLGMRLDYVGHVAPGFELFGPIEQTVVENNVARQFQALADEIERQSAAAHSHSTAGVR
jgi:ribosome-associated toxin RatA of RatAB toxin-antitoxin module